MAGSISGVGGQPQIPLSQPYQPGNKVEAREQETRSRDSASVARTYDNSTKETRETRPQQQSAAPSRLSRDSSEDTSQKRGSVLDITI